MPNEKERTRIDKIKSHGFMSNEKLDYQDLLLLLQHDNEFRELITQVVHSSANALVENAVVPKAENVVEKVVEVEKIVEVEKVVEIEVEKIVNKTIELQDPIRSELKVQLDALSWLTQQPELMQCLNLKPNLTQGQMLLAWCAFASNAQNIIMLWEWFSEQCSADKRAVTTEELHFLELTLQQHNANYQQHKVTLLAVTEGTSFDFEIHKRIITAQGSAVEQCCLAGLLDTGGKILCKPLVKTY
ncbi:hypothetical protein [uncultured Shewanella sp.]|uniref:hypothetical protein n=1 Tax=uncultured Shewanella sp. TaxID=173975 RepID=UPI002607B247|nr:hypothetical protein [uncultured Shewanella sp.]